MDRVSRLRRRRHRNGGGPYAAHRLLAAIDLGTNNCRLLIAEPRGKALQIIDSFSRMVRLGEHLPQTGKLSDAAMDRTVEALKVCAERLQTHGVVRIRAVATEACRRAANAQVLIDRVAQETGIRLDVVSAQEEARLAASGCALLVGHKYDGALVFDIGGGSTEAIWLKRAPADESGEPGRPELVHFRSVPAGVMTLGDGDGLDSYEKMRAAMVEQFAAVRKEMDRFGPFDPMRYHLLGTSGTVTTLAGIALHLSRYIRAKVDGTWHECADIARIVEKMVAMDRAERVTVGCVGEERADLILPGCAIYAAIQTVWPCTRLRVADRGLREGILRDLLRDTKVERK